MTPSHKTHARIRRVYVRDYIYIYILLMNVTKRMADNSNSVQDRHAESTGAADMSIRGAFAFGFMKRFADSVSV
jgi:hypothetical protein